MAEATVQGPATSSEPKYYCHGCSSSVVLSPELPELTCPQCHSDFIEEMTQDLQTEHSVPRAPQMFIRGSEMSGLLRGLLSSSDFGAEDTDDDEDDDDEDEDDEIPARRSRWSVERRYRTAVNAELRTVPRFIEHILRGLTGSGSGRTDSSLPFLASIFRGDPRDYAWGADGLDNAITQLLNQYESSGTPPASKEAIDGLEVVTVTQEYVDKEIQCTVCMEDLQLNDTVRSLACQHLYHTDCIITWLQLHNTCPICRQAVENSTVDAAAAVLLPDSESSDSSEDDDNHVVDKTAVGSHDGELSMDVDGVPKGAMVGLTPVADHNESKCPGDDSQTSSFFCDLEVDYSSGSDDFDCN